jgi:hypothetical protein
MVVRPDRRDLKQEAREMKAPRLYTCTSGDITETIRACGFGDARIKFFQKHGVQATHVTPTKL